MKAIYQKNYKKTLRHFLQGSKAFLLKSEPFDHSRFADDFVKNKALTISHWGDFYSNPIRSVFLYQVLSLSQISDCQFLFCRDGLFCLLDFFHRNPDPGGLQTILILNYQFLKFIPARWRKNVVFYQMGVYSAFNYKSIEDSEQSLILKGAVLSSYRVNIDNDNSIIEELRKIDLKRFKKIKVYIWSRDDYFLNNQWIQDTDFSSRLNHYYPALLDSLKKHSDIEFTDYIGISSLKSIHRYKFLEISPKINYISDDYIDYSLLSKGALPFEAIKEVKIDENDFIPLSAYHGYRIVPSGEIDYQYIGSEITHLENVKKKMNLGPAVHLSSSFFMYVKQAYKIKNEPLFKKFVN